MSPGADNDSTQGTTQLKHHNNIKILYSMYEMCKNPTKLRKLLNKLI